MLVVMVGLPASGKSTWAEANFHNIVSPDRIRLEEFATPFEPKIEREVWRRARRRVRRHLERRDVVCFDATSASVKRRARLGRLAEAAGVPAVAVWMKVPEQVARARNMKRERPVPKRAFDDIAAAFQEPTTEEGFDAVLVIEPALCTSDSQPASDDPSASTDTTERG